MNPFTTRRAGPAFVAHRGYSQKYPENTLLAMRKAFESGACYVECDVQLTRDKAPVVLHDSDLQRITGKAGSVEQLTLEQLTDYSAGLPEKFGDRFADEKIPGLVQFVQLLKQWPTRAAFIEIKRSSIRNFGLEVVIQQILPALEEVSEQVAIISFNDELVHRLNAQNSWKTGWITEEWSDEILQKARVLNPDYMFVDYECLPAGFSDFKSTDFDWVLYAIDDPIEAYQFVQLGAGFIETNDIKTMLAYEKFSGCGCS